MTDHTDLIRRLAMALDTCEPLVDREAQRERLREEGKRLRQITWQKRAESFRALITEAEDALRMPRHDR